MFIARVAACMLALSAAALPVAPAFACNCGVPTANRYPDPTLGQIKALCIKPGSNGKLEMWSFERGFLLCDVDYDEYDGDVLFERGLDGAITLIPTANAGHGGIDFDHVGIPEMAKEDLLYHEHWLYR